MNIEDIKLLRFDTNVNSNKETKIVALYNDKIIGITGLSHVDKKSACLLSLYVDTNFRNLNVGSMIVNECVKIAKESNCKTIGLLLDKDNNAEKFYNKLGFLFGYEYDDKDSLMLKRLDT